MTNADPLLFTVVNVIVVAIVYLTITNERRK
jgi:uncharacterized membrane protein YhdT